MICKSGTIYKKIQNKVKLGAKESSNSNKYRQRDGDEDDEDRLSDEDDEDEGRGIRKTASNSSGGGIELRGNNDFDDEEE